jgi:hypothetical protein
LLEAFLHAFDSEYSETGNRFCSILEYRSTFNSESVLLRFNKPITMDYFVKAIELKYREKGALVGPYQPVKFEAGHDISLDIPMEGLSINGWKITPLIRPVVSSCGHHIHPA